MDGTNNHTPELPLPEAHPSSTGEVAPTALPSVEKKSGAMEGPGGQQPSVSTQQSIVQMQAQQGTAVTVAPADPTALASGGIPSDDVDVIEKEWVEKAKSIVESTRHDPHLQSVELTKFKAEYLKHRFRKDVKVADDKR